MAKQKELSCGIIISDGSVILACQPHGKSNAPGNYDLPKGRHQESESCIETACRETQEETGLKIDRRYLVDLGQFAYLKHKDLHLFFFLTDKMPPFDTLHCDSFFESGGKKVPEVINWRYVPMDQLNYFFPSLEDVLNDALLKYVFMI